MCSFEFNCKVFRKYKINNFISHSSVMALGVTMMVQSTTFVQILVCVTIGRIALTFVQTFMIPREWLPSPSGIHWFLCHHQVDSLFNIHGAQSLLYKMYDCGTESKVGVMTDLLCRVIARSLCEKGFSLVTLDLQIVYIKFAKYCSFLQRQKCCAPKTVGWRRHHLAYICWILFKCLIKFNLTGS